jgi:hypothetical protein
MSVITVDPCSDARWQTLVHKYPSSVFHSAEWMRVLTDTYGFDIQAHLVVGADGAPQAGLPFCRISDLRGERIVSLPFCDYLDPLVESAEQWNLLLDQLVAEGVPVIFRCLHNPVPLTNGRLQEFKRARWHGIDLRPDLDTLWMSLNGAARRAIKKAEQNHLQIVVAEDRSMMRAFFEMHLRVRKYKYQLVAQPYRFFENIWHHFMEAQRGMVLLALQEGEVVAGIVFLRWRDTLFYKFNASVLTNLSYRPNDLLVWMGIQQAKAQGLQRFDFGLSDWDQAGLLQYKRKFASEERTIHFLEYTPNNGTAPYVQQARALLPQLTDLFTDETVPDHITEKAGDALYRFFA